MAGEEGGVEERGKKSKYSGINDNCISIGWQMLLSLENKLPPILMASCPHNKCNCDSQQCVCCMCVCTCGSFLVLIPLKCSPAVAAPQRT